jgi:hypothetical protein
MTELVALNIFNFSCVNWRKEAVLQDDATVLYAVLPHGPITGNSSQAG